jgi:hypothetical protein
MAANGLSAYNKTRRMRKHADGAAWLPGTAKFIFKKPNDFGAVKEKLPDLPDLPK